MSAVDISGNERIRATQSLRDHFRINMYLTLFIVGSFLASGIHGLPLDNDVADLNIIRNLVESPADPIENGFDVPQESKVELIRSNESTTEGIDLKNLEGMAVLPPNFPNDELTKSRDELARILRAAEQTDDANESSRSSKSSGEFSEKAKDLKRQVRSMKKDCDSNDSSSSSSSSSSNDCSNKNDHEDVHDVQTTVAVQNDHDDEHNDSDGNHHLHHHHHHHHHQQQQQQQQPQEQDKTNDGSSSSSSSSSESSNKRSRRSLDISTENKDVEGKRLETFLLANPVDLEILDKSNKTIWFQREDTKGNALSGRGISSRK